MAIFNTLRLTSLAIAISVIPLAYSAEYALVADYLIDGYSDQLLKNKAVIVKDHKITEVLDASDIPKQITRLELPGTTLMPGMINAHEHPLLYKNDYQNGHLQASSAYKALIGLSTLQGLLEAGWTTIRVMGDGDVYYANQDIRKVIDNDIFLGPRLTGAGHYISITGGGGDINFMSPEQPVIADGLIADGPDEVGIVLEHDAIMLQPINELHIPDNLIVTLGYKLTDPTRYNHKSAGKPKNLINISGHEGAHAYAMTKKTAKFLVEEIETRGTLGAVDNAYCIKQQRRTAVPLAIASPTPALGWLRQSTIWNESAARNYSFIPSFAEYYK